MIHSNSHLQNTNKCQRMATDARQNQRQPHVRALMGTAMHDAFAQHHTSGIALLDALDVSLAKPVFSNDFYGADNNILSAEQGAEVRTWCERWRHPLPDGAEVLEVEVRKTFEFQGVTFSCQLDVLYRHNGHLFVRDYKSGYSAYDTEKSHQGALYSLAAAYEHFESEITFEHALVTQNKVQPVTWSLDTMEAMVKELVLIAQRVEAEPDSQRETAGGHCQHCPLRSDCASYDASLKLEGMPSILDETSIGAYAKRAKGIEKVAKKEAAAATGAIKKHIANNVDGNTYAGFRLDKGSRSYYDMESVLIAIGAPAAFAARFRGMQQSSLGNLGKVAEANGVNLDHTKKVVYFTKLMELK